MGVRGDEWVCEGMSVRGDEWVCEGMSECARG